MPLGRKSELRRIRTPHPPPVTYLQLYERIGCCGRRHTMRYHCNFLRDKQLRTPIILGARDSPVVRAVVQIGGECFRIESGSNQTCCGASCRKSRSSTSCCVVTARSGRTSSWASTSHTISSRFTEHCAQVQRWPLGVTDRLWRVEDLVALWESYERRAEERRKLK